ncbi:secreted and transmembrane protein 1 [Pteropus vampyrus]|uniref:Secreted and transmembrane protein 1 n=1 Tax=Pteropus vampyrus TaxID=132908 RepID=A0A6P6BJY2_PTEVA|nr:secreted and transmembrane protein 1 [Pteropus vampyrus]XP_023375402.1 secreted and transmembrane protein 1 [Pteropus vampyrus]XP_023375403.1 secreted and transmembrane protein 1 [Pteropus vampyrus]
MRISTPFLPTPLTLWALLLIAVSPSAQTGKWDDPACTKDVVSVSRGQPAVMTCNISNPFSFVNICMMDSGDCRPIFRVVTQGDFVQDRWKLCIRGGVARLETEEAQDTQAGRYKWLLVGGQKSIVFTTLSVSEPPEPPLKLSSWGRCFVHPPPQLLVRASRARPPSVVSVNPAHFPARSPAPVSLATGCCAVPLWASWGPH